MFGGGCGGGETWRTNSHGFAESTKALFPPFEE